MHRLTQKRWIRVLQAVILVMVVIGPDLPRSAAAGREGLPFQLWSSLPPGIVEAFENNPSAKRYELVAHLNPFYVNGDFNGDRRTDTAVLIKETGSGKIGIAIIHAGAKSIIVLGAGRKFGNGGDDFRWMDAWHLYPRGPVQRGADETAPPVLKGEALMVIKTESASGLIYWNGKRYGWYQQGD
jgi:hypothetical protein